MSLQQRCDGEVDEWPPDEFSLSLTVAAHSSDFSHTCPHLSRLFYHSFLWFQAREIRQVCQELINKQRNVTANSILKRREKPRLAVTFLAAGRLLSSFQPLFPSFIRIPFFFCRMKDWLEKWERRYVSRSKGKVKARHTHVFSFQPPAQYLSLGF